MKDYESMNEYHSDNNTLDETDVDNYCPVCEELVGKDFLHDFIPVPTSNGNVKTWCEGCINTYED